MDSRATLLSHRLIQRSLEALAEFLEAFPIQARITLNDDVVAPRGSDLAKGLFHAAASSVSPYPPSGSSRSDSQPQSRRKVFIARAQTNTQVVAAPGLPGLLHAAPVLGSL